MELLSPAGNTEKLETVYRYGADAAYIGLGDFSLRQRADNVDPDNPSELAAELIRIKGRRRLYGTLNIYFQERDLARLEEQIDKLPITTQRNMELARGKPGGKTAQGIQRNAFLRLTGRN